MLTPKPTYEQFLMRQQAPRKIRTALKKGILTKPNKCEDCGILTNLEGHHSDYSKPYQVKWVCHKCHGKYRNDKLAG